MDNTPLITIIIPVYNREKYLPDTLRAVLTQSYRNIEVIAIDDGSTDQSQTILRKYAKNDNRIKIISQENSGVSVARNRGLLEAKGEFISFIDSDDIPHPDMIKCLFHDIENHGGELSICDMQKFKDGLIPENWSIPCESEDNNVRIIEIVDDRVINDLVVGKTGDASKFFCIWDKLYRNDIIQKYKLSFDPKITLGEDSLFAVRYLLRTNRLSIRDNKLYFYRKGHASIMNSMIRDYIRQYLRRYDSLKSDAMSMGRDISDILNYERVNIVLSLINNERIYSSDIRTSMDIIKKHSDSELFLSVRNATPRRKPLLFILRFFPSGLSSSLIRLFRIFKFFK